MRSGGIRTQCSGHLESRLDGCENHDPGDDEPCPDCGRQPMAVVRYVCTACKHTSVTTLVGLACIHPAVSAFAWNYGIDLGYGRRDLETARWLLEVEFDQELVGSDPPLVEVTVAYEGDSIHLIFDEGLTVERVVEAY